MFALHCGGTSPDPGQPEASPDEPEQVEQVELKKSEDDPHYRAALELHSQGKLVEALAEAREAITSSDTRDAHMLGVQLAIETDELDIAREWTTVLISRDATDADAHYNRGLIAHRSDKYNIARSSYLAALKNRPDHADARYNLALLTWKSGARDEARHHGARFGEQHPDDERNAKLAKLMSAPANPPAN